VEGKCIYLFLPTVIEKKNEELLVGGNVREGREGKGNKRINKPLI